MAINGRAYFEGYCMVFRVMVELNSFMTYHLLNKIFICGVLTPPLHIKICSKVVLHGTSLCSRSTYIDR